MSQVLPDNMYTHAQLFNEFTRENQPGEKICYQGESINLCIIEFNELIPFNSFIAFCIIVPFLTCVPDNGSIL